MVEAKKKQNVIVLGMLGGGKSTIINQILGSDKAPSNMGAAGCTQEPTIYHSELIEDLTVIDTPGFGDPAISTRLWCKAALKLSGTEMDAMIIVCNSTNRVSNDQTMYTMAIKHVLTNFNPKRVIMVFTRCGESGFFEDPDEKMNAYIKELWKATNFQEKGIEKPRQGYPFELTNNDSAQGLPKWLKTQLTIFEKEKHDIPKLQVIGKNAYPTMMKALGKDVMKANDDIQEFYDVFQAEAKKAACFSKSSLVFKLEADSGAFVQVKMGTLSCGDRVMVYDKISGSSAVEEIICIHDHAKDTGSRNTQAEMIHCTIKALDGRLFTYMVSRGHSMIVKRQNTLEYREVLAEDTQEGDIVSIFEPCTKGWTQGTIDKRMVNYVSIDSLILVWTESMTIVVDNVASSCHTQNWTPSAVSAISTMLKMPGGYQVAHLLEGQRHNSQSLLRKGLRFCGYRV